MGQPSSEYASFDVLATTNPSQKALVKNSRISFFFFLSPKLKSSSALQVTIVPHRLQRLKPRNEEDEGEKKASRALARVKRGAVEEAQQQQHFSHASQHLPSNRPTKTRGSKQA